MKKSSKMIIVAVLSATVIGAGVTAYAKRSGFCMDCSPQEKAARLVEKVGDRLDLNQEQSARLNDLAQHLLQLRQEVWDERKQGKDLLLALLAEPTLDQQQVLALVSEKTQLVNDTAPEVVAKVAEFTDSLTAEQKQELVDKLSKQRRFRHHHRHH